jgi:hypothetical protein
MRGGGIGFDLVISRGCDRGNANATWMAAAIGECRRLIVLAIVGAGTIQSGCG